MIGLLNSTKSAMSPIVSIHASNNKNYDYAVTFKGYDNEIPVTKPTQAEIALYANAGSNGLWLSIIEKAYGEFRRRTHNLGEGVTFFGAFFSNDTYSFLNGQSLTKGMKAITGRDPAVVIQRKNAPDAVLPEDKIKDQLASLVGGPADKDGFQAFRVIVTASTFGDDKYVHDPKTLPPGHAYAVVGYDPNTKTLKITNPLNDQTMTF
jgi:hypothetical protein